MARHIPDKRLAEIVRDARQRLRWDDCCSLAPSTVLAMIAEIRASRRTSSGDPK